MTQYIAGIGMAGKMTGMEPKPLDYATAKRKPPTDWGQIGWTVLAGIFILMCFLLAAWIFGERGNGGR
jgi:hypothetical protein